MKRILSLLSVIALVTGGTSGVVSCTTSATVITSYKSINLNMPSKASINLFKHINDKIYVGLIGYGLLISNDGINFSQVKSIPNNAQINNIQQIGTGTNAKIYVTTTSNTYIHTKHNSAYVSTDDGKTFTMVKGLGNDNKIEVIQLINNKIYVGGWGLYKSDDGINFSQVKGFPNNKLINQITIINKNIYIGTSYGGFYISRDKGIIFKEITAIPSDAAIRAITEINNIIYIGTDTGLYTSTIDDSTTFYAWWPDFANKSINKIEQINNIIYVGTEQNGLYTSTDNGATFIKKTSISDHAQMQLITQINNIIYLGTTFNHFYTDPSCGLYISKDNGKTFDKVEKHLGYLNIYSLKQIKNTIYVGTDYGLWASNNGVNFSLVNGIKKELMVDNIIEFKKRIYVITIDNIYYKEL